MKRKWIFGLAATVLLTFSGAANGALINIGSATYDGSVYNLFYEDDQNLVWLDYTHSQALWGPQNTWASTLGSNLTVELKEGYSSTINWNTGWRLPIAGDAPVNWSYDTSSEMGYLNYVSLGNPAGGLPPYDLSPFVELGDYDYWLGTAAPASQAWIYGFNPGLLYKDNQSAFYWGLAVHPGTVSAVPIPGAVWLLGSGLICLVGLTRKFKK